MTNQQKHPTTVLQRRRFRPLRGVSAGLATLQEAPKEVGFVVAEGLL